VSGLLELVMYASCDSATGIKNVEITYAIIRSEKK
jgi:hypothetical protein